MSNMAGRNSSLHQKSKVPGLYHELMQDYIYHSLLAQECKSCKFDPESSSLYEERSYADADKKSNTMILSIPQPRLPKSSINNAAERWNNMLTTETINPDRDHRTFWIKYPRRSDKETHERSIVELFIGAIMNKMRRRIPNFVYTLGGIRCVESKSDTKAFCSLENGKVVHIIQEQIEGMTLDTWLRKDPDPHEFIRIILQVTFALAKAQEKKGFVHKALYPSNIILRPSDIQEVSYHLGTHTYKIRPGGLVPTIIDYSSARATSKGFAICYLDNPTLFHPGIDLCKLISSSLAIVNRSIYNKVSWLNDYVGNFFDVSSGSYDELYQKYEGFNLPLDNPLASLSARNFIQWVQTRQGHTFNSIVRVESRLLKPLDDQKSKYKTSSLSSFQLDNFSTLTLPVNYNLPLESQYDGIDKVDYLQILNVISPQYRKIKDYICIARSKANDSSISRDKLKEITSSLFEIKEILRHNISIIKNLPLYKLYRLSEMVEYQKQKMTGSEEIILSECKLITQSVSDIFPLSKSFIDGKLSDKLKSFIQFSGKLNPPTYYEPNTLEQIHCLQNLRIVQGNNGLNDVEHLLQMKNSNKWLQLSHEMNKQKVADITMDIIKPYIRNAKIESFMDFGGADGKLASIMASELNISKAKTWSADVENWMGNKTSHLYNVSYLNLKEGQEITLPSSTIDLISVHQVLHHVENIDQTLSELKRVCNGFLVLWERDCLSDSQRMLFDLIHSINYAKEIKDTNPDIVSNKIAKYLNDYKAWYRSFDEWKNLLVGSGFKYVSSRKINDSFVCAFHKGFPLNRVQK
jgi:ubiquinone/menaquinone biosynthesis C-methylase UbiE